MSSLAYCIRTILLDPDDLALVRKHVEMAGNEEAGVRAFLAELQGELEGLRQQLVAQGFDVTVVAPEEELPALIATSLQTGKTTKVNLKTPKEKGPTTGDLFGSIEPTAPAEAARNWKAEGDAAFKAGKARMVPRDIWQGVSAGEGNKRADAWLKGWDLANLAAPVPVSAALPGDFRPREDVEITQTESGLRVGDVVDVPSRTIGRSTIQALWSRNIVVGRATDMARIVSNSEDKQLIVTARELKPVDGLTAGTPEAQGARARKEGTDNGPDAGEGLRTGSQEVSGTAQPGAPQEPAGPAGVLQSGGQGSGADAQPTVGPDAGGNQQPVQGPAAGPLQEVAGAGSNSGDGGRNRNERPDPAAVDNNVEAEREIALPPNYQITDDDHIGEGGPKAKVAANLEALRLLKQLEAENRKATPSEQAVLVRYVGWGAFAQDMFQDTKPEWAKERTELKSLLTPEEYDSARASVLNAHYTSADVINGMWDALKHLGFKGGRALEPASGVGHFLGLTPASMRDRMKWTTTELDKVTGAIAKQLYQRADVNVQGFETLNRPNGFYDLAMSNVPFGSFNIRDLRYKQEFLIHDYFFVRSLDLVRPGGIVAFITSSGTMDKANDSARAEIMKRADLVGAIRLPGGKKGAFAGNAGTEVTTDIIFLRRKGERIPPIENAWQNTKEIETPDGPVRINEYFADHPEMMLGQMRLTGWMYREKSPVLEGDATDIRTKILAAAQKMMQGAFIEAGAAPVAEPKVIDAETSGRIKEGAFYVDGAKVMRKVMGLGTDPGLSNTDQEKVKGLIDMRDTVSQLLDVNRDRSKDALARQRLNKLYDAFVKKFGPINKETVTTTTRLNKAGENIVIRRLPNMSAFRADPDAYKVAAIENYDAEKGTATKAALFKGEVVSDSPAAEIKNATDGIGWSLNAFGEVNLTAIADRLGKSKKQVIDELGDRIFLNPNGDRWEPAEQYLAGDVVEKLDDARAAAQADKAYERNVAALEAVQPTPLTQEEITVPFGASWVMPSVYEQFLEEVIGTQGKARVSLNPVTKQYLLAGVNFSISAQTQFGTSKVNVAEIISLALQMKSPRVVDTVKTTEGTKDVVNEEATREAQVKSNLVRKLFEGNAEEGIEGWVWQDADRAELLARVYNRKFNRLVPQKFDGGHLTLPGLATKITDGSGNVIPFALRDHQKAAVWRAIQNGNTLLDHVVGAGKTFTMIAAAMEMKRLGQIQRPMFIVPNHMLEQFSREFLQAYPNANILVAQKDEMTRANRKAFAAKIAAERWDGIVITHDAFGRLPLSKEVYVNFMKAEIEEIEAAIRHMKAAQNKKDPTVKQLEQMKKRAETRLKKLIASERKDEGVLFEELGVDQLILDEAHLFKNLAFYTQHTRVKGLSQAASQRAMDLFLKVRELEKTRPGRSSIFATGTPISNTMAEMYTMQRYLQLDELVKLGIDRFDAWASTFGEIRTNMELSPDGRTFRETSSFSRFRNLPELVALYSKMADTKTADMLNLPRPKLKGGKPIIVEAEPSLREEDYIASLVARAESVRGKKAEKGGDNMLKVVSEGRKVALDFRLIDPEYQDQNPQGKVAKMVENVTRIWRDGTDDPVAKAQLIFLDMGVPFTEDAKPAPKPETEITDDEDVQDEQDADEVEEVSADESEALRSRYNLYEEIRRNLVKQGIPRAQIAFIHEAKDDSKKAALFEKVRRGEVRILLGSTSKMGVGTNVQKRLKAMHHLDAPWKPAEVEQRDGRILRQGNMNPEIEIYRYITKRSFDSFMWQTLERKSNFIAQIKAGARGVRIAEDIDSPLPEAAELKAAASGDPRIMQHAELTKELRDLEAQFASHVRTIGQARKDYLLRQEELAGLEKRVFKMVEDAAKVPVTSGDKFKVEVLVGQKGEYTKRAEAGAVVAAFLQEQAKLPAQTISELKVANFNGLNIIARLDTRHDTPAIKMFVEGYLGRGVEFGLSIDRTPQLDAALMSRMESELADLVAAKSHTEYRIEQIRKELPKVAAAAEDRAFPRMERLKAAKNELAELTKALGEEKNKKPSGPRIMGMAGVAAHTLPITPDMRRTALTGVPLFTAKRPSAPAFTDEQFAAVKSKMEKLAQQILKRRIDVTLIKTMPRELSDEFLAFYDANSRSIMISMKAAYDLAAAVGHESLHALRDAGVINATEWESLTAQARKLGYRDMVEKQYGDLYRDLYGKEWGLSKAGVEDKIDEEAVAYMMGDYTDAKEKMTTFAQKVIDRLMEWARAVVDMMKGEGITAEQVMADIYRGKIANRLASPEGQVMQPAAAVAASATPSQRKSAEAAASPLKKVLELAVQGFGYKIVDTGLPFGYTDRWGKFWSFGTQIIDKAIPGDKIGKWMDSGWKASPELRAYIKEHMTAPWAHRVWFGHDPLANLSAFIDKFGVAALPEWGVQLFKDSLTKAGIPLPGTQWLVQSGLVGDRFATAWLSMNIGEALSGGMSILGTYRLMKQVKNGEPVHKGWAVAGILFKLVGGTLSANPVVLLSAAADAAILVKATAADVRDGLQQVEQSGKKGRMPMAAPTESEAFKRWFGDSKVVDAQGRPLVVYHGAPDARFVKESGVFQTALQRYNGSEKGGAFWFAKDRATAASYADDRRAFDYQDAEPGVVEVYLKMENPLIVDGNGKPWREAQARGKTTDVIEEAQAGGYDGVIIRNVKDDYTGFGKGSPNRVTDTYVVFSPRQIKSVNNPGTWDPSNPRIMGMATPDGSMGGGGAVPPKAAAIDAAAQEELDDLAGNIRLSRLNAPDDIKEMLKDVANKAEGFMSERRGIVSNEQTAALAAELGMTAEELMQRDTGTAFNAQQIFAARVLLLKSAERLKKLAREARTSNSLSTLAQFQKAVTLHRAIQEQVAGMTAEAGRALQQFNMIAAKDSLRAMDALLNGVRNNKASKGAKLGGPNEEARELADMISEMDDPAKLGKFIADMQKATVWDMIREAWINGLLSGPRTHAANILSNTLTALWQVPETFVAEQIGRLHGGDKVQSGEAAARLVGLIEGTKEGIAVGAKHIRHGEALDAISKAELIERKAIPGKVGNIIRMPSRILEAEDQVFKAINYRAEINALALRQAMKEGHRGPSLTRRVAELRANPTHKMQHAAHQAALYQTYQNKLGVKGQWVMNLREAVPLGWLIMPFIRTPANILKYAAERTPLGLLMKPVRENLSGANGTVARDVQLARIALGSAVMVAVVGMAIAGHLTGGPPDDPEEERILRATGWQPYSLRIGDTYYSYQRMDPMALVVGLAADTVMLSKHLGEADLQKTAHMLVMAVANNVKEKTWISGLVTFAEAFFSGDAWKLDAWGRRLGSSVVPAFVAQYAQSQDPYIREAKTLTDAIKARVPGWSETLLARRDVFGEKMMREGALGPDIASPFFVSVDKDNPVAQAMLEIGYYPSMPDRKLAGHELTAQQYDRYVELSGKTATTMLRAAIAKPSWKRMSRDQREEKIREEFSEARKMARAKLKREWPELRKKASEE